MSSLLFVARNERSAVRKPAASSRLVLSLPVRADEKLSASLEFQRGKADVAKCGG